LILVCEPATAFPAREVHSREAYDPAIGQFVACAQVVSGGEVFALPFAQDDPNVGVIDRGHEDGVQRLE
jgi:hypothetical protein